MNTMSKEGCIFCRIVSGEEKAYVVYEDDYVKAVLDAFPVNEGHVLVITKKHIENIFDLPEEEFLKVFAAARKIARAMLKALDAKSVNIIVSESVIKHAFVHVVPRYDYDLMGVVPDMDNKRQLPAEEMEKIAEKIRRALKNGG